MGLLGAAAVQWLLVGLTKLIRSPPAVQSHGYVRAVMANNAVKGPARAIADWTDRKMPVLDYSI